MFQAPCKAPGSFCYGCFCPCILAYQQRNEILAITREPYICCGGICGCGPCGEPCDESKKPMCLGLEVCCCTGMAVSSNRYLIQTRFGKQSDPCDDCIILFQQCLQCLACLLMVTGTVDKDGADNVQCLADCVTCAVMSCMLAQQQTEVDKLKEQPYTGIPPNILACLPPKQQEMLQKQGLNEELIKK